MTFPEAFTQAQSLRDSIKSNPSIQIDSNRMKPIIVALVEGIEAQGWLPVTVTAAALDQIKRR